MQTSCFGRIFSNPHRSELQNGRIVAAVDGDHPAFCHRAIKIDIGPGIDRERCIAALTACVVVARP